jgi:hypothetical protein
MVKYTLSLTLALFTVAGCGAPGGSRAATAAMKDVRTAAYDADFDVVWAAAIDALREDYPIVKVLDKKAHKIVTCWRPIDRDENTRTAVNPAGAWRLYRAIVEISPERPYRVSVAGRAGELSVPIIRPYQEGDIAEPGWREGRTQRIQTTIHERLKQYAQTTNQEMPPPANPDKEETYNATCIIRPELVAVEVRGMKGIPIGDPGAMQNPTK